MLRWDLLDSDLDAVVDALVASRRHPIVLVEDWEMPLLGARFPQSPIAQVNWRARAMLFGTTRVILFDPADRTVTPATWPIDVLR